MAKSEHPIEWFLGRNGKQHGPITELEMRKLVELGHLRPGDLVWRQGMADWAPAHAMLHELAPPLPAPLAGPPPPPSPVPPRPAADPGSDLRPSASQTDASASSAAAEAAARAEKWRSAATHAPRAPGDARPDAAAAPVARGVGAGQQNRPASSSSGPRLAAPSADRAAGVASAPYHPAPVSPAGTRAEGPQAAVAGATPAGRHAPQSGSGPGVPQARDGKGRHASSPGMPQPAAHGHSGAIPRQAAAPADYALSDDVLPRRRRFSLAAAVFILLFSILGGVGAALYHTGQFERISLPFVTVGDGKTPVVRAPTGATKDSPSAVAIDTPEAVDAGFQKTPLWQLLKREFPDWYNERVIETARMRRDKRDEKTITAYLTQSLVDLRRKNAAAALSATPDRLKFVAATFVENLASLQRHSIEACYGFISQGENSAIIIDLMRSPDHSAPLQAQFAAIFEAIADGRKSPRTHPQPKREDYDVLAKHLAHKGWSPTDLQVFSDAQALSRAPAARVCQMVQDWFAAQLAVQDEATQTRLLVEALKPVIAG
jgi:hypothetical protein